MKKILIIAVFAILLVACVPALTEDPQGNLTSKSTANNTMEETTNSSVKDIQDVATNETQKSKLDDEKIKNTSNLPKKEAVEGELVNFPNLRAVDPDGDPITYTFTSPLSEKGTWQTKVGDAGEYLVTITASDGANTVSQEILIVVKSKNKPPVIEIPDTVTFAEGETVVLEPKISDEEDDEVSVSFSGWMSSDKKETAFEDSGLHKVLIVADDGNSKSSKEVIVDIENVNRPPVFEVDDTVKIKEGEKVSLPVSTSDPDKDKVTVSFEKPLDEKGQWQTKAGDAGEYELLVTASDGKLSAEKLVHVIVEALNRAPGIVLASPVTVEEGETVALNPKITDKEGDTFTVTYSGWMNSNTKPTGYNDAGNYKVNITATDSAGNSNNLEIIVSVENQNRPPVFGDDAFS